MSKFIITGGAGSGKTTVINALAEQGFPVLQETAILVIQELIQECGGVQASKDWRAKNQTLFQHRIMLKQIELELDHIDPAVFCDRGLLDIYTMSRLRQSQYPEGLGKAIIDAKYTAAFVLETISPFPERGSTGRTSSYDASTRQSKMLMEDCERFRIPHFWISLDTVQNRVLSILAKALQHHV